MLWRNESLAQIILFNLHPRLCLEAGFIHFLQMGAQREVRHYGQGRVKPPSSKGRPLSLEVKPQTLSSSASLPGSHLHLAITVTLLFHLCIQSFVHALSTKSFATWSAHATHGLICSKCGVVLRLRLHIYVKLALTSRSSCFHLLHLAKNKMG